MKKEVVHKANTRGGGTVCGRGYARTNRTDRVTCGRCKLLAKFAAKRAKKGRK